MSPHVEGKSGTHHTEPQGGKERGQPLGGPPPPLSPTVSTLKEVHFE